MANLVSYFKRTNWVRVHREQLASVARTTPAAMVGYAANTGVAVCAFWGIIPVTQLIVWAVCALGLSGYVGMRSVRRRQVQSDGDDASQFRSSRGALVLGLLLALPWGVLATKWVGHVPSSSEVILVALSVGMAASGSVLLAPVPVAAAIYVSTILVPLILKCFFVLEGQHIILGALAISFLVFLLGLIATNARLFLERLNAVNRLKESVKELSHAREEVERVAMTDGLTGVANNRAFMARLNSLNSPSDQTQAYSIFYLDLDRFKYVNDALGHAVGDALLKAAARRIENCVRKSDCVARIGGDEFAIIAQDIADPESASTIANSLVTKLAEPFHISGQAIEIGASVGVAIASGSSGDGELLLKQADIAMYAAKCAGQGGFCIFEPDMQRLAEERRAIEIGLGSAIANGEFGLVYQPIREMATGAITGMECLLRWHHPTHGLLLPAHFLHVAEDIGMANEIGAWVIEEACRQAVKWPSDVVVGVNLSPLQIASGDVMGPIERALKSSGLPARRLELEITETSLLQSNPDTIDSFRRLKEMGISIALDDFGTGFSSLGYLVNFPFNRIKIDRLFVSQLGSSRQSDLIVKSVAQLAKNLKCSVVAEGIETAEQHRRLRAFNVSHGQGFYLGKPVSAREALKLLAADNAHALAESA